MAASWGKPACPEVGLLSACASAGAGPPLGLDAQRTVSTAGRLQPCPLETATGWSPNRLAGGCWKVRLHQSLSHFREPKPLVLGRGAENRAGEIRTLTNYPCRPLGLAKGRPRSRHASLPLFLPCSLSSSLSELSTPVQKKDSERTWHPTGCKASSPSEN